MNQKTIVIALGGNAITREFEEGNIYQQFANTRRSLEGVVELAVLGYKIAVTHGNGPQVGQYMIRVDESLNLVPPVPLGVIVADVEGGMGYMIGQTMMNKLKTRNVSRRVVTVITQVLVNKNDPSILDPDKFVGSFYTENDARKLAEERGWLMKPFANRGWRRVVPSPIPIEIIEKDVICELVNKDYIVIAAGGGGIPVYYEDDGRLEGVDAVVDKDRTAAILAKDIGADELIILTDTDYVYLNFGTSRQQKLTSITVEQAQKYYDDGHFPPGSMGPKIEAAIQFVQSGGKRTIITSIDNAKESVTGNTGTLIS